MAAGAGFEPAISALTARRCATQLPRTEAREMLARGEPRGEGLAEVGLADVPGNVADVDVHGENPFKKSGMRTFSGGKSLTLRIWEPTICRS